MGIQVSASNTHLLLNCPRPFAADTPIEREPPGGAANYGSALHEVVAAHFAPAYFAPVAKPEAILEKLIAAKWGVPDVAGLAAHASQVVMAIQSWLSGNNDWGAEFRIAGVERHLATRLRRVASGVAAKTRETGFDEESHTYELSSYEFGGTYDILASGRHPEGGILGAVLDIKTGVDDWHGGSFAEPSTIDQLRTLAVMTEANIVGVVHCPSGEEPVVYAEEISPAIREAHAVQLRKALALIDTGFMRPGESQCRYCPAKVGCPARDAELIKHASALVKSAVGAGAMSAPVELGEFHMLYQEMKRVISRAGEEMKARVKAGEIHFRPDGMRLTIRTKEIRNLSMASIRRALGKEAGEKLIKSLTRKGCVETRNQEELHAVKDD